MTGRTLRLALTGLLGVGLVVTAAVWPSRPHSQAAVTAGSTATPAGAGPTGAALFQAKGCASCHTSAETTSRMRVAPDLRLLPTVAGQRMEGLDAEEYVRLSIRQPQAFVVPGYEGQMTRMPTLPVNDQELDALVQYLLG